jgi:hypothetical protein
VAEKVLQALVIAEILSPVGALRGVIIAASAPPGLVEYHHGLTQ